MKRRIFLFVLALDSGLSTLDSSVAQVGVEPTASLRPTFGRCPSQGGLPVAYRAVVDFHQYPEQGSNLQSLGDQRFASVPGPSRSTDGVSGHQVVLGGLEPPIVSL